jgi:hypothetical protein
MALRTPSLAGGSPLTPRYGFSFDEPAAADALAFGGGGVHGALFVATERAAMADAQLQRDARVESLQRRWAEARRSAARVASSAAPLTPRRAQVASAYNDWLQDTLLLASERWPVLDGSTRLDVRLFALLLRRRPLARSSRADRARCCFACAGDHRE